MAKIEELTELLVAEIGDLENSVKKLEEIRKAKIKIDFHELKETLSAHQRAMQELVFLQDRNYERFNNLVEQAKIYPTWAVAVFIVSIILNCLAGTLIILYCWS